MDDQSLEQIVLELQTLVGRVPGKIFQLEPLTLVIDFRIREGYLLISSDPSLPRLYLIKRRVRDLGKTSRPLHRFAQALKAEVSHLALQFISKDVGDRIVRLGFSGEKQRTLVAQLTGRAANLFVLDEKNFIIQAARGPDTAGHQPGERYQPPQARTHSTKSSSALLRAIRSGDHESASEAADAFYIALLAAREFDAKVAAGRAGLRKKISRQQKLLTLLQQDLASHHDAAEQKRIGDLLLANTSSARRKGNRATLIDYFAADQPTIEVEVDEKVSLAREAERRFKLYSRAKRAVVQIKGRLAVTRTELDKLQHQHDQLEKAAADRDDAALAEFSEKRPSVVKEKVQQQKIPGTRCYLSTDGYRVLVGRGDRDNDNLTFKVARPNDLWLHTADYPGSHVIVRNSTRKELPQRAIIEAAQLAAHFSQANKDPKVDVRYTQRKFISKPRGSAPGLVRMSRFKSITVTPKESLERVW